MRYPLDETTAKLDALLFGACALFAVALGLWVIHLEPVLKDESVRVLRAASAYLEDGAAGAAAHEPWPFYSILLAEAHRLTGLAVATLARGFSIGAFAGIACLFVLVVRALGGDPKAQAVGGFAVIAYPTLNEFCASTTASHGFWLFTLIGLWALLRFLSTWAWAYALTWAAATIFAAVFRVEAALFALAVPAVLLLGNAAPRGRGLTSAAQLYAPVLAIAALTALAVHFASPGLSDDLGLRQQTVGWAKGVDSLDDILEDKAAVLGEQILPTASRDDASVALFWGMVGFLLFRTINEANPVWFAFWLYSLKQKALRSAAPLKLALYAYLALSVFYIAVLLFYWYAIPDRYLVLTGLLVLLWVPLGLQLMWRRGRLYQRKVWRQWLVALVLAVFLLDSLVSTSPTTDYLVRASDWLKQHGSPGQKLLTNQDHVGYFSGMQVDWSRFGLWISEEHPNRFVEDQSWRHHHWLALRFESQGNPLERVLKRLDELTLVKVFENEVGHRLVVFRNRKMVGRDKEAG